MLRKEIVTSFIMVMASIRVTFYFLNGLLVKKNCCNKMFQQLLLKMGANN